MNRLLRSQSGNVGLMTAALIVPLVGIVGSGVDFSRYFLVKQRLQLACDAGALAGRKYMDDDSFDRDAKQAAQRFFDTNFVNSSYGTRDLSNSFREDDGTVIGNASLKVDTAVLQIFTIDEMNVSVSCSSKLDLANTDVMFVMDTTGSMSTRDSGSQSRLQGLRDAVKSFVKSLEQSKGKQTQVRYGFVPYSSNVNVGHLLKREWMTGKVPIESREKLANGTVENSSGTDWTKISGSINSYTTDISNCNDQEATTTYANPTTTTTTQANGTVVTVRTERKTVNGQTIECGSSGGGWGGWFGGWWGGGGGNNDDVTQYNNVVYQRTITTTARTNYTWRYKTVNYDVPTLIGPSGSTMASPGTNSTQLPVGNMSNQQPTMATVSWNGCIRELPTREITDFNSIPNDIDDIDINHIPDSTDASKWRMALPRLAFVREIYERYNGFYGSLSSPDKTTDTDYVYVNQDEGRDWAACPSRAKALAEMNVGNVVSYLQTLEARGSTYHDIGLVWGGRLLSPNGIYGDINEASSTGGAISRHLIFLTDGETSPSSYVMSAYGMEYLEPQRGSYYNLSSQIDGRTQIICRQIKNEGITLWVIAFGPGVNDAKTKANLKKCASPDSYFEASDNTQLETTFMSIAEQIAELRLVD